MMEEVEFLNVKVVVIIKKYLIFNIIYNFYTHLIKVKIDELCDGELGFYDESCFFY